MEKPQATFSSAHRQSELFKDIAVALNQATDINSAMEAILPKLGEFLGLSTAWAFRFDPVRKSFVEVGASGLPPALAADDAQSLKTGWCECQEQFVQGTLDTAINIVRCSRLKNATGDKRGLVFHASIPLKSKGKPLGILNVAASGRQVFTNEFLSLLETIGNYVAVAVDRSTLLSEERHRSNQLRSLLKMSTDLTQFDESITILQTSIEQFVRAMGYFACGVFTVSDSIPARELVALAVQPCKESPSEYQYGVEDHTGLLPPSNHLLLESSRSYLEQPILHTQYLIRVESPLLGAFTESDQDLLTAFALALEASLNNAKLHQQSVDAARWTERRKLAADLHDAVSQRLFSASLIAKAASLMVEENVNTSHVQERLHRLQELLSESQQEMRDLIQALRPAGTPNLLTRLKQHIEPLQWQSLAQVQLHTGCDQSVNLPASQTQTLLRIVDEALHNALKHSKAKSIEVTLDCTQHALEVSVKDDGVGFAAGQLGQGVGTNTMHDRAQSLGGQLVIESLPGLGTTVRIELPLPWKEDDNA